MGGEMVRVLVLVTTACAGIAIPAGAQWAKHYKMEVAPGGTLNIGIHRTWLADCTTAEVLVVVTKPPKHGKVITKVVPSKIPAKSGVGANPRQNCVGKPAPGTHVTYKADKGYIGEDSLSYEATYQTTRQAYQYSINIK